MRVTRAAFQEFVIEWGETFPYNDIRKTRGGLYPKWLLMKANHHGVLFRPREYFLVRTACLSNDVTQVIITKREGLPLPRDYSEVADCLEHWGRRIDGQWEQAALNMLCEFLLNGEVMSRRDLFYQCLVLLVERHLLMADFDCGLIAVVIDSYFYSYYRMYHEESKVFHELARKSIAFAHDTIAINATELNVAPLPVPTPVSPERVESE